MEVIDLSHGYLRIEVYNEQFEPVSGATVTIYNGNQMVHQVACERTDTLGQCQEFALEAPHVSLSLQSTTARRPYATYSVEVAHVEYDTEVVHNVQVFADCGSTLPVELKKKKGETPGRNETDLGEHKLYTGTGRNYA